MTAQDRERHRRNQERQNPALPSEGRASAASGQRDVWLARGLPAGTASGAVWLKRPMPNGQWPPDQRQPRDDSYRWWVRATCGHQGGAKQWAFYDEMCADVTGEAFRANPCWFTRCPDFMIKNEQRTARG